jgi:hypothetical protein
LFNLCTSRDVDQSRSKGKQNNSLVCDLLLTAKLFNASASPNRYSSASANKTRGLDTSAGASSRAGARYASKVAAPAASTAAAGASTAAA